MKHLKSIMENNAKTMRKIYFFNSFQGHVSFVYSLKTSRRLWFSDALRGLGN